jgi:hypothetical protein
MRGIEERLGRISELLGARDCVCASAPAVEILLVKDDWDEERIRAAEEEKRINCPVHGRQSTPVLRLAGSDIYG